MAKTTPAKDALFGMHAVCMSGHEIASMGVRVTALPREQPITPQDRGSPSAQIGGSSRRVGASAERITRCQSDYGCNRGQTDTAGETDTAAARSAWIARYELPATAPALSDTGLFGGTVLHHPSRRTTEPQASQSRA